MKQEDKFEKITIDLRPFGWGIRDVDVIWPKDHEGGTPGPNTVGTEQIIDGAVEMEDLDDNVKGKIQKTYDEDDETLHMDFDEADVNNSRQAGFDAVADDGSDDI